MSDAKYLINRINRLKLTPYELENKKRNLSDENSRRLASFKDKHKGERCFVLGGSPSLRQLDLSKLLGELTFTTNRGYSLAQHGLIHSTYHVMSDFRIFCDDKLQMEIPVGFANAFFIYAGAEYSCAPEKTAFFDFSYHEYNYFQADITRPLGFSTTVIFEALQIAAYMGFSQIYILGVDLDLVKLSGHAYVSNEGEKRRMRDTAKNAPDMLKSLMVATERLGEMGVNLFNASPVGIVDCMPRVKYENLFQG